MCLIHVSPSHIGCFIEMVETLSVSQCSFSLTSGLGEIPTGLCVDWHKTGHSAYNTHTQRFYCSAGICPGLPG